MRDHIRLFLNGRQCDVAGADAFLTLSDFLRLRIGLRGTKIVCSEGDCGSCTVLVGHPKGNRVEYKTIDSCIRFVFQLDGLHVVTVEGLCGPNSAADGRMRNSVQNAMIDCHGSQCGFCTPGFVVAMTGLLQENSQISNEQWRTGLTGNLCRCTGYSPILAAGRKAQTEGITTLNEIYDATELLEKTSTSRRDAIEILDDSTGRVRRVYCPATVKETLALLKLYPDAKIVAGSTDVGVQFNKGRIQPQVWIDLNRVTELEGVEVVDNCIHAGARATWSEIEEVARDFIPDFEKIVSVFGSPQIRHVGTIGGNVINASPIADSLPLMMVCGAQLELVNEAGTRKIDINDFYQGYKQFDLRPGEILTRIEIPLPSEKGQLRLYKISRRKDLDISSFTAAILIETAGTDNGSPQTNSMIADARIAFGAVGPVVLRLKKTEAFLRGQNLSEQTMRLAGDVAVEEISPITDVRGGKEYRSTLARNVLLKFFFQSQHESFVHV